MDHAINLQRSRNIKCAFQPNQIDNRLQSLLHASSFVHLSPPRLPPTWGVRGSLTACLATTTISGQLYGEERSFYIPFPMPFIRCRWLSLACRSHFNNRRAYLSTSFMVVDCDKTHKTLSKFRRTNDLWAASRFSRHKDSRPKRRDSYRMWWCAFFVRKHLAENFGMQVAR